MNILSRNGTTLMTTPYDTLVGADLRGANLQGAILRGAYMTDALLDDAMRPLS